LLTSKESIILDPYLFENFVLVPLARTPHLTKQCIELLNEEWPRSSTMRDASVEKSLNETPPMCLVLLDKRNWEVVGHAKLCPLPQNSTKCWVESVVLRRSLRGRGLGRNLMEKVESLAKSLGFSEICLSTTDKRNFYERCSYNVCPPILNFGANSKLFESMNLNRLFRDAGEDSNIRICRDITSQTDEKKFPIVPPPPPQPKFQQNISDINLMNKKVYMRKPLL